MSVQFCNPDGTCKDLSVLTEYLDRFQDCKPTSGIPGSPSAFGSPPATTGQPLCIGVHTMARYDWLLAVEADIGGGGSSRAKYKSAYMKRAFTAEDARCMYKHMTRTIPGVDLRSSMVEIDSYGGAINRQNLVDETAAARHRCVTKVSDARSSNPSLNIGKFLPDFHAAEM